ncbi:unnamed protein product [Blepharisma stoltei]|uniref:Uncharacterized protein n=1 Tax=Blepharisma stoltei TaxID=1481888 RepID=A0AAU9J6V7_9CILI|nr:unnamed protein product [Blepharisma stoltei]
MASHEWPDLQCECRNYIRARFLMHRATKELILPWDRKQFPLVSSLAWEEVFHIFLPALLRHSLLSNRCKATLFDVFARNRTISFPFSANPGEKEGRLSESFRTRNLIQLKGLRMENLAGSLSC